MSELDKAVTTLTTELDDRMENLEAIKGKTFAETVRLSVNMQTIMQVGASDMPQELRAMIIPDMCAMHIANTAKTLGLTKDETIEAIEFAQGISDQITAESKRMRPLFDKEIGKG